MNDIGQNMNLSDKSKTHYFSDLALRLRWTIKLHQELLWKGNRELPNGKNISVRVEWDWNNVTQHCLVVAARAEELWEKIWLSEEMIHSLMQAAILHDVGKEMEKNIVTKNGLDWNAFDLAWEKQAQILEERWYDANVVYLSGGAGHTALEEVREILQKWEGNISEREKAFLILHYIDNYTVWDTEFEDGTDPLKKRIQNNKNNERYKVLDEDGKSRFRQSTFNEQLEVWIILDEWFQKQLWAKNIPWVLRRGIKEKISNTLDS